MAAQTYDIIIVEGGIAGSSLPEPWRDTELKSWSWNRQHPSGTGCGERPWVLGEPKRPWNWASTIP